jgi:hypothetical protein
MTCLHTVRDGQLMAFEFFWNHEDALKTMGLEE